jgi:hypothetical protein
MENQPNANRFVRFKYAEEWLDHAVSSLRDYFYCFGYTVPSVLVNCGYGLIGYSPKRRFNVDGLCLPKRYSKDDMCDIYVAPHVTEPIEIILVLAHELIHSIDDCFSGHGATFMEIAGHLGLNDCPSVSESRYLSTLERFAEIVEPLGKYPRSGINYKESFVIARPDYQQRVSDEMKRRRLRGNERKAHK